MLDSTKRIISYFQSVVLLLFMILGSSHIVCAESVSTKTDFSERYKKLLKMSQSTTSQEELKWLTFEIIKTGQEAINADDYSAASKIANLAIKTGNSSKNNQAYSLANVLKSRSNSLARKYRKVQRHHQNLQQNPDNSTAAFLYGKYLTLIRNDWEEGLPLLAKGDDDAFRIQAEKELVEPNENSEMLAIADGWLELATKVKGPESRELKLHAYDWYSRVWNNSTGIDRLNISTKMNELPIRYLNHMAEIDVTQGAWPLGKNGNRGIGTEKFTVNKMEFPNGLGLHPPSNGSASVRYNLDGQYNIFATGVALIDDTYVFRGTVYFWVLGDGKVLWKSAPIRGRGDVQFCRVSVKNINKLELRTESPQKATGAHAVWLDPHVLKN